MTDLEVMNIMVNQNQDIKATTYIHEVKKIKQGGLLTFGIDHNTVSELSKSLLLNENKHYIIAYIVNKEQFDEIKNGG